MAIFRMQRDIYMDIMEAIRGRRSIRKYAAKPPEREKLEALVEAGFLSPSGSNAQNWFFTVITNEALLGRLEKEGKEAVVQRASPVYQRLAATPGYKLLQGAPCCILVGFAPEMANGPVDAAIAVQNICLAAYGMGLGTCINGLINCLLNQTDSGDLRHAFGIPDGMLCAMGISVGYPDEAPAARPRDRAKVRFLA